MEDVIDQILADTWRRQQLNEGRWSGPVTLTLADLGAQTVGEVGPLVIDGLGGDPSSRWSAEGTRSYILAAAKGIAAAGFLRAAGIIAGRAGDLDDALQGVGDVLNLAPGQMVNTAANFAAVDAGERVGAVRKQWVSSSSRDPRPDHAAMGGEEAPIAGSFSNGLRFPGSNGPPAETANCQCSVVIVKEDADAA